MNEILKKRIEKLAYSACRDIADIVLREQNIFSIKFGAEYALSHQWISVDEALPKEDSSVYMNVYVEVDTGHGIEHCVLLATYTSGKFSCETKHVKVIGWMPIPEFETRKK